MFSPTRPGGQRFQPTCLAANAVVRASRPVVAGRRRPALGACAAWNVWLAGARAWETLRCRPVVAGRRRPGSRQAWRGVAGALLLWLALVGPAPAAAQSTPPAAAAAAWVDVADGSNLVRPAFWDDVAGATAHDGIVSVLGADEATLVVDRYGPRLDVSGDVRLVAGLQAASDGLAAIALVDAVPDATAAGLAARRVEVGLLGERLVVAVFDGSGPVPSQSQTVDLPVSAGPVTVGLARIGGSLVVEVGGSDVARLPDPGIFQTGQALIGARVAAGNRLDLSSLSVQAPAERAPATQVERCAPDRLLVAGQDDTTLRTGIWWVWPDDGLIRQVEASDNQRSVLVAVSPDSRWVTYYQRSNQAPPDHFVADTWVMNLGSDDRSRLVEGNSPLGWMADSKAVVLGERPYLMAMVPGGELVPTSGKPALADSLRSAPSPDRQWRAGVATSSRGAEGVEIIDTASNDVVMSIPTGRGAIELAWSPDSTRLAFTAIPASASGFVWQLQIVNLADRSVAPLALTRDMDLHSVVWAPALPGCAGRAAE